MNLGDRLVLCLKGAHWGAYSQIKWALLMVMMGALMCVCLHAFAEGMDVLAGTTNDMTATVNHSGKQWIYLIELLTAIGAYIKSKNIFVFGGIAAVAIFIHIVLHLAGGA